MEGYQPQKYRVQGYRLQQSKDDSHSRGVLRVQIEGLIDDYTSNVGFDSPQPRKEVEAAVGEGPETMGVCPSSAVMRTHIPFQEAAPEAEEGPYFEVASEGVEGEEVVSPLVARRPEYIGVAGPPSLLNTQG